MAAFVVIMKNMKLLFISLGCDKNLVDSEFMIGMLTGKGMVMCDDETEADVIIINSCCWYYFRIIGI